MRKRITDIRIVEGYDVALPASFGLVTELASEPELSIVVVGVRVLVAEVVFVVVAVLVEVGVQYPFEPQVSLDLQHSFSQHLPELGHAPEAQHVSVSVL